MADFIINLTNDKTSSAITDFQEAVSANDDVLDTKALSEANQTAIGSKLEKGTYGGNAQNLKDGIDGKLEKGAYDGNAQDLKDEIDSINFENLKTYGTLAELNAVASPTINDSAIVGRDGTATNNGYYGYDGSAWVKNSELVENIIEETNTSKGVSGKAVFEQGKVITNKIYDSEGKIESIGINNLTRKDVDSTISDYGVDPTGVYGVKSGWTAFIYDVSSIDFIRVAQDSRNAARSAIYAFYSDNTYTNAIKYEVSPLVPELYYSPILAVPSNAKYVVLSRFSAYGDQIPELYSVSTKKLKSEFSLKSDINLISNIAEIGLRYHTLSNDFVNKGENTYLSFLTGMKKDDIYTSEFHTLSGLGFSYFFKTLDNTVTNVTSSVINGVYTSIADGVLITQIYRAGTWSEANVLSIIQSAKRYTNSSNIYKKDLDRIQYFSSIGEVPKLTDTIIYNRNNGFEGLTQPASNEHSTKFLCEPNTIYVIDNAVSNLIQQFSDKDDLPNSFIAGTKIYGNAKFLTSDTAECFIVNFADIDNPDGYDNIIIRSSKSIAKIEDVQDSFFTNINCIGDSLTQGSGSTGGQTYPYQLQQLLPSPKYKVNNYGIGGLTSSQVLSVSGGVPLWLTSEITIPSTSTGVNISISQVIKDPANGIVGNPYNIAGIEGVISNNGTNYVFTRSEIGDSIDVPEFELLVSKAGVTSLNGINIIYVGVNNVLDTDEKSIQLVEDIKLQANRNNKYIVLSNHRDNNLFLRELLRNTFAINYLDLYAYFNDTVAGSNNAKKDAVNFGLITQTESNNNTWQTLFLADVTHFNNDGYFLLSKIIYNKLLRLQLI